MRSEMQQLEITRVIHHTCCITSIIAKFLTIFLDNSYSICNSLINNWNLLIRHHQQVQSTFASSSWRFCCTIILFTLSYSRFVIGAVKNGAILMGVRWLHCVIIPTHIVITVMVSVINKSLGSTLKMSEWSKRIHRNIMKIGSILLAGCPLSTLIFIRPYRLTAKALLRTPFAHWRQSSNEATTHSRIPFIRKDIAHI
ncbi:hypothetical protein PRIPAC_78860 [Pristionchus pacificus]|uniref:Uncharacterized protein n=1 Tax=Pristionchus pacificus TaxID=54126 RepID=A0A2A6CPC5_PRIPA|nr:hypothetical protein PRIPAC_78860 [Pristionchus pacificus]|eukprot:PDM79989.1 hypothetical protein PRIPAC_32568 [Pristionchus pacificus]